MKIPFPLATRSLCKSCDESQHSIREFVVGLVFVAGFSWTLGAVALAGNPARFDVRELSRAPDGEISQTVYDRTHGLLPLPETEKFHWQAEFRLTLADDGRAIGDATALTIDCVLIRQRHYVAPQRARIVWDGRVYRKPDGTYTVAAYSGRGEQVVGTVDDLGQIEFSGQADVSLSLIKHSGVMYDPFRDRLWCAEPVQEPIRETDRFFLPFDLVDQAGRKIWPTYRIDATSPGNYALIARVAGVDYTIATCDVRTAKSVTSQPGYAPGLAPPVCLMATDQTTRVFTVTADICRDVLDTDGGALRLRTHSTVSGAEPRSGPHPITIDGRFADWRNVPGIGDPLGDIPGYLQYNADTDLLEFKVTHDDENLYFYTRVVGQHGNTAAQDDRYYFYAYIDADCDPTTGYTPTRDDDCYFGVSLGDDCEAQFEFANGGFYKTFYGFAGAAGETDAVAGRVTLGPSWYNRFDAAGREREGYKVEYIRRGGRNAITQDLQRGTSDCIVIAISPDGHECEMRAALEGFLVNQQGKPIIGVGQSIDVAVGVEAAGRAHGNSRWGADSTAPIRNYRLVPARDTP